MINFNTDVCLYEVIQENGKIHLAVKQHFNHSSLEIVDIIDQVVFLKNELHLHKLVNEKAYIIGLDAQNCMCGIYEIGIGDYKHVDMYRRETALFLLLSGATTFNMFHNHPSRILKGSEGDMACYYTMQSLGNLLDIQCTGSYILTPKGYCDAENKQPIHLYEENEP